MRAYPHNDKQMYLDRVKFHQEHDELTQGIGWESNGTTRGCVPEVLAILQDKIFESLDREDALAFPEQFLSAIQPGADLALVWPKLAVWMLIDPQHGIIRFVQDPKHEKQKIAIENVASLWQRVINGEIVKTSEWQYAAYAAYAAYATAAASAAYAYTYAAYAASASASASAFAFASAAYAATASAAYAAYATAASYAADATAAQKTQWKVIRDKLISLLSEASIC